MVQVAAARNDPHGVFLGGACHFFPIAGDSVHAELLACRRGVQLALEVGVQKIILETDNQGVAQSLAQQEIDRSRFAPLVKEMRDRSFKHSPRACVVSSSTPTDPPNSGPMPSPPRPMSLISVPVGHANVSPRSSSSMANSHPTLTFVCLVASVTPTP